VRGGRASIGALAPFVSLLTALGLADSVTSSFLVIYLTGDARLSVFETGIVTSVATLSGILLTAIAGRAVDRRITRLPLLLALLVAALGFAGLALVSGFAPVLLVVLLTGASAVGFPQVFALERASAARVDGATATGALRAGWSLAWALGPLIASGIVTLFGYRWLFILGAIVLVGAAALTAALRLRPRRDPGAGPSIEAAGSDRSRPGVRLTIVAIAVFHLAMFVGSFALPLLITGPGDADPAWVGITFGICAGVEVPAAFLATRLLRRRTASVLLIAAAAVFALYFVVIATVPVLGVIVGAQVLRGLAIAVMGIAGIEALRELMAPRLAAATAAFANALAVGSLLAGIGAGAVTEFGGARTTTFVAALLAAIAVVLLAQAARRRRSSPV
jgi:SET family sugar efflux transporter-like MFS transporter